MAFTVVAPQPNERAYERVIERFDRYFRYYAKHALGVEEPATVEVMDGNGNGRAGREARPSERQTTGPTVVLSIGEDAEGNGWSLKGEALTLHAPNEQEAIRRTEELLAALDRRFEHIVPFLPVYGMAGHHLTARGLHGLTMTEALAQEGQTW